MKKILILCFVFLFSTLCCSAQPIRANKLYEQNVNSVFFIDTQNAKGSGVILSQDGTFVTCFHVIADANYINVQTKNGEKYKVTGFKYLNPKDDVAILTIKSTKKFKPFTTASSNSVSVGDTVYTISNPANLQFVFSDGMVNQKDKTNIQYSAPSSPGSSGGALINSSGNLIGIIASQYNLARAQNINFAIKNEQYLPHLSDKVKKNTRNLNWSEFVASKLTKKELERFIEYAYNERNSSMLYKYLEYYYKDTVTPSDDYAFKGLYSLSTYTKDRFDNPKAIENASKWFALSILSNKNVEEASFGLFVTALFKGCPTAMDASLYQLHKYPDSYRKAAEIVNRHYALAKKEKSTDAKAYTALCIDAYAYYLKLAKTANEDKE